jgi:hypothetical protein
MRDWIWEPILQLVFLALATAAFFMLRSVPLRMLLSTVLFSTALTFTVFYILTVGVHLPQLRESPVSDSDSLILAASTMVATLAFTIVYSEFSWTLQKLRISHLRRPPQLAHERRRSHPHPRRPSHTSKTYLRRRRSSRASSDITPCSVSAGQSHRADVRTRATHERAPQPPPAPPASTRRQDPRRCGREDLRPPSGGLLYLPNALAHFIEGSNHRGSASLRSESESRYLRSWPTGRGSTRT